MAKINGGCVLCPFLEEASNTVVVLCDGISRLEKRDSDNQSEAVCFCKAMPVRNRERAFCPENFGEKIMKSLCKIVIVFVFVLVLVAGNTACISRENTRVQPDEEELLSVAKETAALFDYYDEISPNVPNIIVGTSETGGQCGDYALAFVNRWNEKHPDKALLIIQQQGLNDFPDGIYEVTGKDEQELPFLKYRTTSMLYVFNNVKGLGHPLLGGYKIRLIERRHIKSHFDIPDWENNGPHVWVLVGNTGVDPTFADIGLPITGKDKW
jgi:hypothetical protein